MKVTVAKKSTTLNLNVFVNPELWNSKGYVEGRSKEASSMNEFLEESKGRMRETYRKLLLDEETITPQRLKAEFTGEVKEKDHMTLVRCIEEHNEEMKALLGIKFSKGTLKNYRTTLRYMKEFVPVIHKVKDVPLKELDHAFIVKYESYLLTEKNCTNNGVMKQVQRLNKIMHRAIKMGWLDTNPFRNFKVSYKRSERGYLSISEVKTLESAELPDKLQKVRDVFVFQIYTGLAYCDVKELKPSHIAPGIDGKEWIFLQRQKTQVKSMIPILPIAKRILNTHAGKENCLPVISNQKMNKGLKEIASLCGIEKRLTTHLARHTFATTITLSNGVPIETVSKMLGHTKLSTTQIYSKIVEQKIADDMAGLRKTFNEPTMHYHVSENLET